MLQPARRKHRKEFRGTMTGVATRGSSIAFGEFGLKAMECGWMSAAQIESARRTITHHTKRLGRLYLRVFPHKPITKKAAGARMGSGKADIHAYVAVIRPGTIIFELSGVTAEMAKEAMRLAAHKIGVATKFIVKA
ncbi:50S ribosomal protein L16 [Candidatus Collierbacteria bacterium RIFCSPLOWO2_01_FULL_50_23]|uniref:Large ribosomal subunit protein uL16 n=2 Tax=Candidatus Collieribacteriota TaxID=1752725 RepID=A0A1F5EUN7_9BACT|nr:ribosomal protein L16 [uncultured bacterium]OGD71111.1 MAG: 50S ribosomal protein L16 [Candidatus Collierbacteria bacterium RIFCSPHIGHO2_02_FULL_49_10]OGD71661.1 MAG: 50S ribosomal protein L16 [Candidatus Collierbacteria bacterium RIFCSPHIGHO2_01_FULL_50_25]OGD73974.1 MAG: 50S ribosomal protein L16 [Candidatus Collierbacteria bacterium RIFCSPLOWO2_01_FULL_50_23]